MTVTSTLKKLSNMNKLNSIPFQNINWDSIPKTEYKGETGTSFWQTVEFNGLRIRIVEYSKDFTADHWCQKGHIVHCLEGSLVTQMENAKESKNKDDIKSERGITLSKGNTYIVSDDMSSHRSVSRSGAKLLIIDGEFMNL